MAGRKSQIQTSGVRFVGATLICITLATAGCHRETRQYLPQGDDFTASAAALEKKYEGNAFQVAQGKRLFQWFNCSGCHSHGGGGMGPPLMDDEWRYGCSLLQIHRTIRDGRPNGMPAFVTRIPDEQIWQLAAYVRSMSGNLSRQISPGRNDELSTPVEQLSDKQSPPCKSLGGRQG
jgi:cytochrome c oxidase cbb3-type subunit 3